MMMPAGRGRVVLWGSPSNYMVGIVFAIAGIILIIFGALVAMNPYFLGSQSQYGTNPLIVAGFLVVIGLGVGWAGIHIFRTNLMAAKEIKRLESQQPPSTNI